MYRLGWEHSGDSISKDGIIVVYRDNNLGYYVYNETIPENLKDKISEDFRQSLGIAELKYEIEMKKN